MFKPESLKSLNLDLKGSLFFIGDVLGLYGSLGGRLFPDFQDFYINDSGGHDHRGETAAP